MNKPQLQLPIDDFDPLGGVSQLWRPIHYLGSKLRIVEPLRLALDQVDPTGGPVCDLFAGSGTVSGAFAGSRDVIAVDIQEYSRVICSAVLNPPVLTDEAAKKFIHKSREGTHSERLNAAGPLIEYERTCLDTAARGNADLICELIEHASMIAFQSSDRSAVSPAFEKAQKDALRAGNKINAKQVVLRHFGGLYFSYEQATELDTLLIAAHDQPKDLRDSYLAAIISTASEIVNTVGKHFAQPIRPRGSDGKPKRHLISKIIRDRKIEIGPLFENWLARYRSLKPSGRKHEVIRADFADALTQIKRKLGVVYADPPYTRDHYSRFYHVLETMCLWDEPAISMTRIRAIRETFSRGIYRADRHQSPFCIKSQAPVAFEKLFAGVRDCGVPLVLSYSPYAANSNAHPRVMTVDQIEGIARKYFTKVEQISAGKFSHMKLNAARLHIDASTEAELIFLLT